MAERGLHVDHSAFGMDAAVDFSPCARSSIRGTRCSTVEERPVFLLCPLIDFGSWAGRPGLYTRSPDCSG
jgi:hypothetical protein